MGANTKEFLLISFFVSSVIHSLFANVNHEPRYHTYSLESKSLNSKYLSEYQFKQLLEHKLSEKDKILAKQYWQESKRLSKHKSELQYLKNFMSIFDNFSNDKCLIVINNFQNIDIKQLKNSPVVFKKFDLAILHRTHHTHLANEVYGGTDIIWAPNDSLPFMMINDKR